MTFVFQLIGYVGTFLSIWAYVPQIRHLLQEHCSAGISIRAYVIWIISSLCILLYSLSIMAIVIIVMQLANLLAICTILVFAKKYQGDFCPYHAALQDKTLHTLKVQSHLASSKND
jgi:uncharacterized protein with PQ loop repeat